jgi:eukaryotic-like serine/threonine-protein kinase
VSTPPVPDAPGQQTVLAGRYALEGKIAAGGMGEVWRAIDQTLGRPVAVKLLRPEYASDESFLVRFRGEARHAARLSHPGVASVYDYGEVQAANGRPTAYLVMELVEGEPLSALLHRERRLSADQTLDILSQAADALAAAHAHGVVHRDVKPGNLLVRNDGVVKVTDFGIARAMDAAPLTATGIMMGTAYYVSPEQASGKTVTPASDVYSLGVVAYECLAGRRPFDDRNPIVVVLAHQQERPPPLPSDVPPAVAALVASAMEKSPSRRPPSASDFAQTAMSIRQGLWSNTATWTGSGPGGWDAATQLGPMPGRSQATRGGPRADSGGSGWDRADRDRGGRDLGDRDRSDREREWGGRGATQTAYGAGADDQPARYSGGRANRRAPARSGRAGRARPAAGRRLTMPVLVALLVATVVVTALITRTLAGGGKDSGNTSNGAHASMVVAPRHVGGAARDLAAGRADTGGSQGGRDD